MEKQFIPYELAVKLKELGFDEKCLGVYYNKDGDVRIYDGNEVGDAPLWQQAARFLNINSNNQINITINGKDDYEGLCKKFEKAIKHLRDL